MDDRLTCKISDFGLTRGMSASATSPVDKQFTESDHTKIPIKWTAPEAISSSNYTGGSSFESCLLPFHLIPPRVFSVLGCLELWGGDVGSVHLRQARALR